MTGYGVRKAAQEVAQVLNVPDVQELPVKPARQKAPKRDMSLTVATLMKESHTGESPYLTGKGFAGYTAALTPKDAGNQVGRAVNRFALVAMAGELATRLGITGWPEGEALRATRVCLNAWLKDRGHTANQEDIAALEQVRSFFTANQYSRFADWHDERNRPGNMVGWRRVEKGSTAQGTEAVTTFYVMPSGWKEICRGFDPRKVARLCADRGYLLPSTDGKLQTTIRPPEMNPRRLYVFNSEVPG